MHSSSRTRAESGKDEAHEVGGHAAEDQKIKYTGLVQLNCVIRDQSLM